MAKIGDFGESQNVAPLCINNQLNCSETAPESWGDDTIIKSATAYDEKADIFSFAIVLWRLFVEMTRDMPSTSPGGDKEGSPYPSVRNPMELRAAIRKV